MQGSCQPVRGFSSASGRVICTFDDVDCQFGYMGAGALRPKVTGMVTLRAFDKLTAGAVAANALHQGRTTFSSVAALAVGAPHPLGLGDGSKRASRASQFALYRISI